ncbi:uncharacterized protein SCHCODRAFT_01260349 [Schizophyllum commune H4-8]|uniref:uncharacterized protein n=1 Tax=Schizophyllum commune (strain H4-8 / FGSC 9210) TaxID=578458 RepID=UPI00215F028D|nr:uncharacterized protein SCHCODRAFT_01260349 [Schizophyllum commune H4-8]KAI5885416.1 hypothetical protein SCHCODRAFT_01260349 [Schizophyllum commune H4-8]
MYFVIYLPLIFATRSSATLLAWVPCSQHWLTTVCMYTRPGRVVLSTYYSVDSTAQPSLPSMFSGWESNARSR